MTDLFSSDPAAVDPNKNYLTELVGEGKKFQSPEELAKGKFESDLYVKHLTTRLDELRQDYQQLRDDYSSRADLKELIDQLNTKPPSDPTLDPKPGLLEKPQHDPREIESLVSNKIAQHEQAKRETENLNSVVSKLRERYGNNYQTVLEQHMVDLDLSKEYVSDLAKRSPKALLRTLGLDQEPKAETFQAPPRGSERRSDNFSPSTEKRTWSYYQKMKVDKPEQYRDPKTNVQMYNDRMALGDAFEDGDYNRYR